MSRCIACNCLLSNEEAKRQYKHSREEVSLCDDCLHSANEVSHIPTVDPTDYDYYTSQEVFEIDEMINHCGWVTIVPQYEEEIEE